VIEQVVEQWLAHLRGELPGGLDGLLHDEVVFYSPIVFTPQRGKAVTTLYLEAAAQTFPGDHGFEPVRDPDAGDRPPSGGFRYTKRVTGGDTAVLEFETTMDGRYVNGVDIIRCDAEGRIIEFRVMIRPLQAVEVVRQRMAAMVERMGAAARPPEPGGQ
jgi:hypothetical protein